MKNYSDSYKSAGVDVTAGYEAVRLMKDSVARTKTDAVLGGLGGFGGPFVAVSLFFFAFSTIVGWYFFGEQNVRYLFGSKAVKPYSILVCCFIVLGCCLKVDIVWNMSDMFNGLMVIPNLMGLIALTKVSKTLLSEFEKQPAKAK